MINFVMDKVKDKAWSVLSDQADRKLLGGALGRFKERFSTEIFVARLLHALIAVKGKNAKEISDEIMADMRSRVPVDRGALRDSIRFEGKKSGGQIIAGGTSSTMKSYEGGVFDEALAVEYGTTKMPAQPFFYPTVRKWEKEIEARLARMIEREAR